MPSNQRHRLNKTKTFIISRAGVLYSDFVCFYHPIIIYCIYHQKYNLNQFTLFWNIIPTLNFSLYSDSLFQEPRLHSGFDIAYFDRMVDTLFVAHIDVGVHNTVSFDFHIESPLNLDIFPWSTFAVLSFFFFLTQLFALPISFFSFQFLISAFEAIFFSFHIHLSFCLRSYALCSDCILTNFYWSNLCYSSLSLS